MNAGRKGKKEEIGTKGGRKEKERNRKEKERKTK